MASSSKPKKIYDVFLSFRGTDVRNNFLSHLNKALDHNGIYTFIDSEELNKGDQISPALMEAIKESRIAIIIFSKDYASSWWCLEELAKIMECKEQKYLTVLPIFYKVDPKEVRGGKESYGRALAQQESKFGKDSKKVKRWKKALFDAGSLSGWHLNDGVESELIQSIVKEISIHLDQKPLHVAKHPIGIASRVVKLKSMLSLESNDDVLMVGVWGQGGIGKTTIAKAIYNEIFKQFRNSCFLADVRDCKDLVTLQEKLLVEMLSLKERLVVSSVDKGINLLREKLCHKKVLLILDNVDDHCQLNALAGECKWFGSGSRIIVTTRDKHLLTYHRIDSDHVYEVEALDESGARDLLIKHAFPTHTKLEIKMDLVDKVLNHAKGLPLALEVLGASLCGRTKDEWESTIHKLSMIPNKTINDVLKISYDNLEENEREIFLDIACFFKGKDIEYTKKVLNSCDREATIGLQILIERSLIKIESRILQMHDLIQVMGRDIVKQESRNCLEKRSRLWLFEDILDVMSHDMGDCSVKAIVLEQPKLTKMHISPNAFTKMERLRLLILRNVQSSFQGPICLPAELRWLEWPGCGPYIPEFSSSTKKLKGLDMSESSIIVPKQFKVSIHHDRPFYYLLHLPEIDDVNANRFT
ncbi:hypothetical protein BT93_E1815 [Corymbia citriodora subsp. variegata]|nr:hypothetical protein BT93_E1815 [Corymbia citriodora subsp. variegata]